MIIRQARVEDAAGIAQVHVKTWQITYRGIVPDDYLDTLSVKERQENWERGLSRSGSTTSVYVAENEENGEIVGFVSGGPTRHPDLPYPGELYAIYILTEYQQHGLGRRLVQALARALLAAGMAEMLLWVFEDNLASRRFYEYLGGQYVKSKTFEIAGVTIIECAYAWSNLSLLVQDGRT